MVGPARELQDGEGRGEEGHGGDDGGRLFPELLARPPGKGGQDGQGALAACRVRVVGPHEAILEEHEEYGGGRVAGDPRDAGLVVDLELEGRGAPGLALFFGFEGVAQVGGEGAGEGVGANGVVPIERL